MRSQRANRWRGRRRPLREIARLTALQWSREQLVHGMQGERAELVERVQQSERHAAAADAAAERQSTESIERVQHAEQHAAEADAAAERHRAECAARIAQLDAMRSTRAWRLARRYWLMRDRLATRRGRTAPPR